MLQLRPECVEPLQQLIQKFIKTEKSDKDEIVTCTFDVNIQFDQLDEQHLLPKDVMCIVYEYFNEKITIDCSVYLDFLGDRTINFNIDNTSVYTYDVNSKTLYICDKHFKQIDDSISIIYRHKNVFNLSLFYQCYCKCNNLSFFDSSYNYTTIVINNEYTIMYNKIEIKYIATILNHEILQGRIVVMKQLIDIIKKFPRSAR